MGSAMIRVLVVDDHPVLRAGLEAVLRAEPGFVCVGVAADGATMTQALSRTAPDVIVLDRHLGDEDGLALCAAVRADRVGPQVVIYTADWDPDLDARARAAGASGAVAKERAVDELFDALRLAVRRRGAEGSAPRAEPAASQLN
jgi:DNA-binding NarL/FixJ family response regulator